MPHRGTVKTARRGGSRGDSQWARDAPAREAIRRFVRVLARCGCAPEVIEQAVAEACREVPKSWTNRADHREGGAPGHVMTLWFSDPGYLDAAGNPRPLPLHGKLSIDALARRVDGRLDANGVVRYLLRGGGLRRVGRLYVPRDRALIFRGAVGLTHYERLRGLFGLLNTMEHNTQPKGRSPGRFDVLSWNPSFPVKDREAFDKRLRRMAMRLLVQMDADMHSRERARGKGERTVPFGVGVYRFEEEPRRRGPVRRSRSRK